MSDDVVYLDPDDDPIGVEKAFSKRKFYPEASHKGDVERGVVHPVIDGKQRTHRVPDLTLILLARAKDMYPQYKGLTVSVIRDCLFLGLYIRVVEQAKDPKVQADTEDIFRKVALLQELVDIRAEEDYYQLVLSEIDAVMKFHPSKRAGYLDRIEDKLEGYNDPVYKHYLTEQLAQYRKELS